MCDTFFDWDGETQRRLYKSQNCFYNILYIFQFHKGSIKTAVRRAIRHNRDRFQFHKGSIKTVYYDTPL